MVKFKCIEPGCDSVFNKESDLKRHYSAKHKKPYMGGGAIDDDVDTENDTPIMDRTGQFDDNSAVPIDVFAGLRRILDNNGLNHLREGIINMFQSYDTDNLGALEEILRDYNITPKKIKIVIKTYRANLGMKPMEDETVEEKEEKLKKEMPKDPTAISTTEIMSMSPGELIQWQATLGKYKAALEFQSSAYQTMFGGVGGYGGGQPGAASQAQSADMQRMRDELNAMKEEKRMATVMQPILDSLKELKTHQVQEPKKNSFDDLKEMVLTMKLLDGMGSGKEANVIRAEGEKHIKELQMNYEKQKDANQQLQIDSMKQILGNKIGDLEQMLLTRSTPKDELLKNLAQAQEINTTLARMRGEAPEQTAEDKKLKTMSDTVQGVINTVQPVMLELAKNMGRGGQNPKGQPRMSVQGQGAVPSEHPNEVVGITKFQCTNPECGKMIEVGGHPSMIHCPHCDQTYADESTANKIESEQKRGPMDDAYVSHASHEPTDDELKTEFNRMTLEEVQDFAESKGIDISLYAEKDDLINAMLKLRK